MNRAVILVVLTAFALVPNLQSARASDSSFQQGTEWAQAEAKWRAFAQEYQQKLRQMEEEFRRATSTATLNRDMQALQSSLITQERLARIQQMQADARWRAFDREQRTWMRQLDEQMRRARYELNRGFKPIHDPLITKYFPNYRFYSEGSAVFALSKEGRIVSLGAVPTTSYESAPDLEVMRYQDFLKKFEIAVIDRAIAMELGKLTDTLFRNRRPFDVQPMTLTVSKHQKSWIIERSGPPSAVNPILPTAPLKFILDEQNRIKDIQSGQ